MKHRDSDRRTTKSPRARIAYLAVAVAGVVGLVSLPLGTAAVGDTALDLGSSGAYVTFGDPAKLDLAQFTIETWFKKTGPGVPGSTGTGGITTFLPLVTHGGPESDGSNVDANWILGINTTGNVIAADFEAETQAARTTRSAARPRSPTTSGTTPPPPTTAHHGSSTSTATRKHSRARRPARRPQRHARTRSQAAGLGVMLRSNGAPGNTARFQGVLDEARVWDHARTSTEILASKNLELTSGTGGLVARWGMDEGSGATVGDSIATAANGTITGTGYAWVAPAGNAAPVAVADAYYTAKNAAKVVAAPGVLGNDTDADPIR